MRLTNYGLIRAYDIVGHFPESTSELKFDFLVDLPESLAPGESFVIPYRLTAMRSFSPSLDGDLTNDGALYGFPDIDTEDGGGGSSSSGGGSSDGSPVCALSAGVSVESTSRCPAGDVAGATGSMFSFRNPDCGGASSDAEWILQAPVSGGTSSGGSYGTGGFVSSSPVSIGTSIATGEDDGQCLDTGDCGASSADTFPDAASCNDCAAE